MITDRDARPNRWLAALAHSAPDDRGGRFWSWLAQAVDPGAARPRRSETVEVARIARPRTGASYVLKQPAAGTYLRLTADEHFVWQRLDGRSVRELLAEQLEQSGSLAPGRLFELLGRLASAGLLEPPPREFWARLGRQLEPTTPAQRAIGLVRGALLAEVPLSGATRLTTLAYRAVGWAAFRPAGLGLLVLIALAGPIAYFTLIGRGGFELLTSHGSFAAGFLVFALANAVASLVAEAGRALATEHHGRQVRAGGLRVLLLMPTFFADTRDICMAERVARLRVAAAGPGALLVGAGAAGLVLLLRPPEPFADFLFKLALLCYGTAAFYLNPLIELDGYTLLSEWLEQPDLRERSLAFVRGRLLGKLQAHQRLDRQEQALAIFGVLAVVWTTYTATGGVYFFGWRILAGLSELWSSDEAFVRETSRLATLVVAAGLALAAALILVEALTRAYRWAERRGLLTDPSRLALTATLVSAALALGAWLVPVGPTLYRALVAPPLLMVVLLYAHRTAGEYRGALLRWFFGGLAGYAGLIVLGEEVEALQELGGVDLAWAGTLEQVVALLGPAACLAFGLWLASLATSRYRAPLGLLAGGLLLYAGHVFAPDPRVAAALAAGGCGLLAGGVLAYYLLRRRPAERLSEGAEAAAQDDAGRLVAAVSAVVAQLMDDLVSQDGRLSAGRLAERFNRAAAAAGWSLELRDLRLRDCRPADLLAAGPRFRAALGLLLDGLAARCGRPFAERALAHARDGLHWEAREVFDAWILEGSSWGQPALGRARAERAELTGFLRRLPLFAGLDEAELGALAAALRTRRVAAGRAVIRQGELGDEFYLLRSGVAEVRAREPARPGWSPGRFRSRWRTVARLGEGAAFGELALLHDQPRSATVRGITALELLVLGRADFDRLVRQRFRLVDKLGPRFDRERLLAAMPLFARLGPVELDALTQRLEEVELPAGAVVVRQGEPGDRFYLVREGDLTVSVRDEAGRERQVARLGPGEYFGEIALVRDQPRSATVTASGPARLFALRKADFDALLTGQERAGRELELVASRRRLDLDRKSGAQYSA